MVSFKLVNTDISTLKSYNWQLVLSWPLTAPGTAKLE
jgi:hypothetical protein